MKTFAMLLARFIREVDRPRLDDSTPAGGRPTALARAAPGPRGADSRRENPQKVFVPEGTGGPQMGATSQPTVSDMVFSFDRPVHFLAAQN
jgi:hypothetical protein